MKVFLSLVALLAACLAPAHAAAQAPAGASPAARQTQAGVPVTELVARLRGKDRRVAGEAHEALVARGDEAVPHLERLLKSEKDAVALVRAAVALGSIRPEHASVVGTLVRVAKGRGASDSRETLMARRSAGMMLALTPAGIRALPALLKDGDVFVRRSAAFALDNPTEALDSLKPAQLEAIGEVLPALVAALDDKDEVVRVMSCEVLEQVARRNVEPLGGRARQLLKEKGRTPGDCK